MEINFKIILLQVESEDWEIDEYTCVLCDYSSTCSKEIKIHKNSQGEQLFPCNQCNYVAKRKYRLNHHYKATHLRERINKIKVLQLNCDKCEYVAGKKSDLNRHQKASHPEKKVHLCHGCSFTTVDKRTLKEHIESIHDGVRYPCDECEYQATRPSNLRKHKQVKHTTITFPCEMCSFKGKLVQNCFYAI